MKFYRSCKSKESQKKKAYVKARNGENIRRNLSGSSAVGIKVIDAPPVFQNNRMIVGRGVNFVGEKIHDLKITARMRKGRERARERERLLPYLLL